MVGVPRSKGCQTCLRRHVKCNEERPTCLQCRKSGYECKGYDKELTFRNQTIKSGPGLGPIESAVVYHMNDQSQETTTDELVILASEFLEIACPRELDLSAFEDKFMLTCLFTNYVHGNFGSPWLDLSAAGKLGLTSRTASLAVASEFFSQHHEQPKFKTPGVELYGTSLRLMRKELADRDNSCAERFIVPIMIMITYDFLTWQDGLSCDHFHGLSRVIQLCGPKRFQEEPYTSAFETAREILIMVSLHDRKRSFFERPEWKSTPWARNPTAKSPANRLLDILADIPGLLEDQVVATCSDDPTEISFLRQRALAYLGQLYKWRWTWEEDNPDAVSEIEVELSENEGASPAFTTRLVYSTYIQVNEIGLYNAIQMWILCLLSETGGMELPDTTEFFSNELERSQAERRERESVLLLPGEATSLSEVALEVLRSFECQLQEFYKNKDSVVAWVLPMGLAHQIFLQEGSEATLRERSTQLIEGAPSSFRNACFYIAQSVRLARARTPSPSVSSQASSVQSRGRIQKGL